MLPSNNKLPLNRESQIQALQEIDSYVYRASLEHLQTVSDKQLAKKIIDYRDMGCHGSVCINEILKSYPSDIDIILERVEQIKIEEAHRREIEELGKTGLKYFCKVTLEKVLPR